MTKSEAKAISTTTLKAIHVLSGINGTQSVGSRGGEENFPWVKLDEGTREEARAALKLVQDSLHYILDMASAELGK